MITFKSFMELDELVDLLIQRFWIEPPPGLTPEELEDWTKQKQVMIRLRYCGLSCIELGEILTLPSGC